MLADLVEWSITAGSTTAAADGRFELRGRNADLLEIAGKRASLGDLTRKLLAIPGVVDGVVFQLDEAGADGVRRIAALAVAPDLDERGDPGARCALQVDPVFLPRPLRCVPRCPATRPASCRGRRLLALLQGRDP